LQEQGSNYTQLRAENRGGGELAPFITTLSKELPQSWAWWYMSIILAVERLRAGRSSV
jgi:hypothetical protein